MDQFWIGNTLAVSRVGRFTISRDNSGCYRVFEYWQLPGAYSLIDNAAPFSTQAGAEAYAGLLQ